MNGNSRKIDELIGMLAGCFTTFSFTPQVLSVWRQVPKPATAISLQMYLGFCIGIALWIYYGLRIASRPIIVFNIITITLASSVLTYKLMYG